MKALIEIIKEDPLDALGAFITFSGLFFLVFMASAWLG